MKRICSLSALVGTRGGTWRAFPAAVFALPMDDNLVTYRCTGAAGHPLWSPREPLEAPCKKDVEAMYEDGSPHIRWHAIACYRTENGTLQVEHDMEALSKLYDRIERGPHWDTIEKIEVYWVNHIINEKLTVLQTADEPPLIRWHAIAYYRTENGTLEVEQDMEELSELDSLIELGPHEDTIEKIEVFRVNHITDEKLTVERSTTL
jgi:hypothetical protein